MKVWIARDKGEKGNLWIYRKKPTCDGSYKDAFFSEEGMFRLNDNDPVGKGVTFENSPQQIKLVKELTCQT